MSDINIDFSGIFYIGIAILTAILLGAGLLISGFVYHHLGLRISGGSVLILTILTTAWIGYNSIYLPEKAAKASRQRWNERQISGVVLTGELYYYDNPYLDSNAIRVAQESGKLPAEIHFIFLKTVYVWDTAHNETIHREYNTVILDDTNFALFKDFSLIGLRAANQAVNVQMRCRQISSDTWFGYEIIELKTVSGKTILFGE